MFARPAPPRKTNQIEIAFAKTPWLSAVLLVGLGGAAYTLASIFALHYFLESFEDGSLIDPQARTPLFGIVAIGSVLLLMGPLAKMWLNPSEGAKTDVTGGIIILVFVAFIAIGIPCPANIAAFIAAHGATSFIAYFLMHYYSKFPSIKLSVLSVWWCSYLAIWIAGAGQGAVNLPVFILLWSAIGFGGGLLVYTLIRNRVEQEKTDDYIFHRTVSEGYSHAQGVAQTRRRAARTSGTVSRYGRIPQDTVDLLSNHIRRITGPITAALPIGSSLARRNTTVLVLLDTVISDWRENDNFDLMTSDDIDDFQSFIEAASFLADAGENGESNESGESRESRESEENPVTAAIYKASLNALAKDWLANWNATDNSGPPDRIY